MVVCPKCQVLTGDQADSCKCGWRFTDTTAGEVTAEARKQARELVFSLPERTRKPGAALPWISVGLFSVAIGTYALFDDLPPPLGSITFVLTLFVFSICLRKGVKPLARTAQAVLRKDARDPVLYCRPFRLDDEPQGSIAAQIATIGFESSPLRMFWQHRTGFSLEMSLSGAVRRLGPFVAIGSPKDRYPAMGACRIYCREEEWRAAFRTIAEGASAIIAQSPTSESVKFELETVIEIGAIRKLFIVLPRDTIERRRALNELGSLQGGVLTLPPAETLDGRDYAVLAFRSASEPVVFLQNSRFYNRVLGHKSADALYSAFLHFHLPVKRVPRIAWAGTWVVVVLAMTAANLLVGLFLTLSSPY